MPSTVEYGQVSWYWNVNLATNAGPDAVDDATTVDGVAEQSAQEFVKLKWSDEATYDSYLWYSVILNI